MVYTRLWTVEIILDLAGYSSDRRLAELTIIEPSAGDGAFLRAIVRRLIESCRRYSVPLSQTRDAIRAYEIDKKTARLAVKSVLAELLELNVPNETAALLADTWIQPRDFLEDSLEFPRADFVVGNPPYIRLEEIPGHKAIMYRRTFRTMRGRADIYIAFYEAALRQLKVGGVCAFICADRWLVNDYGSALREFITTEGFGVRYVIDAHDVQAFETEVSAYPVITVIARETQNGTVVAKAIAGIETANRRNVVKMLTLGKSNAEVRAARFSTWFTGDEPWPCSSPDRLKLLKELENRCFPLESPKTGTRIGIGVATGADRVFVTDTKPAVEPSRILPLAMAFDLKGGSVDWSGHYLLNPWDKNGLVELKAYPRFEKLLTKSKEQLAGRHTAQGRPDKWHKTIDRVNLDLIGRRKLYVADIKDKLLPSLDEGKTYPHHNLYWITSRDWDLRILGGLLMSEVGEFFIHCYGVRMRGGYLRFQAQYLRRIRVPDPKSLSKEVAEGLSKAFERQDRGLATEMAKKAYGIRVIPE